MSATLELTKNLINIPSVTPSDKGCQKQLAERLEKIGFDSISLPFDEVENLWSRRGKAAPLFVFAGHTDVVPSGPPAAWDSEPFIAAEKDGFLYGRGAADMKGGIAAMVTAAEAFVAEHPQHNGSIAFLITGDEEGPAINGTRRVVEYLQDKHIKIDWCIVGEPSSDRQLGDTIRVGRRGSLNGILTVHGTQGHVAYPDIADNPVHRISGFLAEILSIEWDRGNDSFPPTTFQVSNINAGTGADNVIPGSAELRFNFRFSTEQTPEKLRERVIQLLNKHELNYDLEWSLSGRPFLTEPGRLVEAGCRAIKDICGIDTRCSTAGGTSDGRFIAPTGAELIELGVVNATIHKINECVSVNDLDKLSDIYKHILKQLLLD